MKNILFVTLLISSQLLSAQVHDNPFEAKADQEDDVTYTNPVIPGFYSDPSICRVGEDYYLVTSTFEYFPGVPVFHSKDLVNWKQIGHCIDRKEQLPKGINIFAATIRHHEGTFYMITTNVVDGGNFYVTATDPAGPWSEPTWVDIPGIDPDLFFDDDGKSYVISSPFILYEIDLESGTLLSEGKKVYHGTGGRYSEGPHIYKKDGFYYLMAAEGGTEEAHSETIARSNNIWGPYIENPANPILFHANAAGQNIPIGGVGHADIIQAHDDSWWIVFHGYRKSNPYPVHHILGRETCLAPVCWPKNGWPVVNGNGTAPIEMRVPTLPLQAFEARKTMEEFDGEPGLEWNFIHIPEDPASFLKIEKGKLKLRGLAHEIGHYLTPAFLGRRLQQHHFTASTSLDFNPSKENELAGLSLVNNGQHFDLLVKGKGKDRKVYVSLLFGDITYTSDEIPLEEGPVTLRISGEDQAFVFSFSQGGEFIEIERVDSRFLSTETVGWFTGVYVGPYATGQGKDSKSWAAFEYFEYKD